MMMLCYLIVMAYVHLALSASHPWIEINGGIVYGPGDLGFGYSVANVGDFNGDGFDDMLVGIPRHSTAILFYGRRNLADLTVAPIGNLTQYVRIVWAFAGDFTGSSVSGLGDINGDGFDDIIIGSQSLSSLSSSSSGLAYVIFGRAAPFTSDITLSTLALPTGFAIQGAALGDQTGTYVGTAGDVNNDGLNDILVTAPSASPLGRSGAGTVYLLFGRRSFSSSVINLATLTNSTGVRFDGAVVGDNLGSGTTSHSVGDFNRDGIPDFVISAPYKSANNLAVSGTVYVIFGKASGWADLDMGQFRGTHGIQFWGETESAYMGYSVRLLGDVNNDGYLDLAFSSNGLSPLGRSMAGQVTVFYGRNGPYNSNYNLATFTPGTLSGYKIFGERAREMVGFTLNPIGDFNNDGFADFLVGSPYVGGIAGTKSSAGCVYVIWGRAGSAVPNIDLLSLTSSTGFKICGAASGNMLGFSSGGAGDIDGDGFPDIVLTSKAISGIGKVYVVFGRGSAESWSDIDLATRATFSPTALPSISPSALPTQSPTAAPSMPTVRPTVVPTAVPTCRPTRLPTQRPTVRPTLTPTVVPSIAPTAVPTIIPTFVPTTENPTNEPTDSPTDAPSVLPTVVPTDFPTLLPSVTPSAEPSIQPSSVEPSVNPSVFPSMFPSQTPSFRPTPSPSVQPTVTPTWTPSFRPTPNPSQTPSALPTSRSPTAAPSVPGLASYRLVNRDDYDYAGSTVGFIGDVNGDGFDDVAVSAKFGDNGASYILYGPQTTDGFDLITLTPGVTGFIIVGATSKNGGQNSGSSLSGAGDINNDGYDDILIGAMTAKPFSRTNAGTVYVIFGGPTRTSHIWLGSLSPSQGFRIFGAAANDNVGLAGSIASAGDINGDGFKDIIIGAPGNDPLGRSNAGSAYVLYGKASGFVDVDLGALTSSQGFRIAGAVAGDNLGRAVSSAGDFNGDGYDDIILGASNATRSGLVSSGRCNLIYGKASRYSDIDLMTFFATRQNGIRLVGAAAGDFAGYSVSKAGDVNGDGFADVLVGAYGSDFGGRNMAGVTYVIFGRSNLTAAVDIKLSTLARPDGVLLFGGAPGDQFGFSVSTVGDLDKDGLADLLVGSPGYSGRVANAGMVTVVYGKALVATSSITRFDTRWMSDTSTGFRLRGFSNGIRAGASVSGGGDFNGDGFPDFIFGAPNSNFTNDNKNFILFAGAAYLYMGGRPAVALTDL